MNKILLLSSVLAITPQAPQASSSHVADSVIAQQRATLAENTQGRGYGPQSPRNIDNLAGNNTHYFGRAPEHSQMNLCNIHFHKNAEHKGGEFNVYAGNGDGKGNNTGYVYNGKLNDVELKQFKGIVGAKGHGQLEPGDTIELHYVHSTAQVKPGPTLGACLSESISNPQLRVETQVLVLVNDRNALNFVDLTKFEVKNGFYQARNIPTDTGKPIQYAGSTTGPSYNQQASPLQVTWSIRPKVSKVDIASVAQWLESNEFNEEHAHGVRNLVTNPDLLSSGH